jgi:two-component system, NarL family, nitrate/nitrite response regulator NarL
VEIVAEAIDAQGAIAAGLECRPDLCLLDVYMPGSGIAAASELNRALPGTPIVMLSVSDADDDLFDALRAGACGYLLKDTDPKWLPAVLRGVFIGEAPLPRILTARLIQEFQRHSCERRVRDAAGRTVTLSDRESQVLELLRADVRTGQIARRLGITPATVRRHVSDILRKLRVADRNAALQLTAQAVGRQLDAIETAL